VHSFCGEFGGCHFLTALPVYNEVGSVNAVLDQVLKYSPDVLVVDDGSTDGTSQLLDARRDIAVVRHPRNRGYGAALQTAFEYAISHEERCVARRADIVSGSRYLQTFAEDSSAPADRRQINQQITREINEALGLQITDAFCGFKAYRVCALRQLRIHETGYAMPLEVWVQAAHGGLRIEELAVPLIYLDAKRSFGETLDNPTARLEYYRRVLADAIERFPPACRQPDVSGCGS
jgi:glycosyltransferase involved in cell wall biosynthesis